MNTQKNELQKLYESIMCPQIPYRSLKKDYNASKNINEEICYKCSGRCCKQCGCHFSSDDFKVISFNFLRKQLNKGYISIDYVPGEVIYQNIGVYILRIRNCDAPIVDLGYKRTPCILLGKKGCKLSYEKRPTGGKLLIPSNNFFDCNSNYTIEDCCYEWKPHQRVLNDLCDYFENKDIKCSL